MYLKKKGKIFVEHCAKVYEDTARPAKYFYKFLQLEYPVVAQEFVEGLYGKEFQSEDLSLDGFIDVLKEKDPELLREATIKIIMDAITTSSSLLDFHNKIQIIKKNSREYLLLVRGTNVSVLLGKYNLIKDGKVRFLSSNEFIKILKGKKV